MKTQPPSTVALLIAFAIVCVVGIVVLAALHDSIPDVLASLAVLAGGAAAGVAHPAVPSIPAAVKRATARQSS